MASKTKKFRVAVEGQTATDGRKITRQMITECVETFNTDTYGVRINMEHLRGFDPAGVFGMYGDVEAVSCQEDNLEIGGKTEKRMALYAVLKPDDALVELNRKNQKVYTSIEPQPNFGGTGKFGLVGLAVTDSPASLGTQRLEFSVKKDDPVAAEIKADLDRRKRSPDSFFSAAYETRFELEDAPADKTESALERFATLFAAALGGKKDEPKPELKPEPKPDAPSEGNFAIAMQGFITAVAADRKTDTDAADRKFAALQASIGELKTSIETTQKKPDGFNRPVVTGGSGKALAQY
jgi:hypothetical protein